MLASFLKVSLPSPALPPLPAEGAGPHLPPGAWHAVSAETGVWPPQDPLRRLVGGGNVGPCAHQQDLGLLRTHCGGPVAASMLTRPAVEMWVCVHTDRNHCGGCRSASTPTEAWPPQDPPCRLQGGCGATSILTAAQSPQDLSLEEVRRIDLSGDWKGRCMVSGPHRGRACSVDGGVYVACVQ